ncbi:sensor histidine kinase [Methylophaga lonarensis]|uniref:sensor histidine kinase n=1 Tax=Methylophaga lonarensis TaxID=999151 RepID=UPI003D265A6B
MNPFGENVMHPELSVTREPRSALPVSSASSDLVTNNQVFDFSRGLSQAVRKNRQAENTRRLENRMTRLMQVLPAGVVVLDGAGRVQQSNAAAIALLGEPLNGQKWISVIDRAFSPQPDDGHDVSLKNGRRCHISTSPLEDEPGQIVLLQDVTETRALQQKVSHLQRLSAMGEMAARLAHQIRTPLSSALLYLAPILKQQTEPELKQRFASKLHQSLTHMEQLVRNMLAFARGDMNETGPVALEQLLDEVQQQFDAQPDAQRYALQVVNSVVDGYLYGSQPALVSVLNNLLNNAREACGEQGEITIYADYVAGDAGEQCIEITVEDNGCGISASDKDRVLQPFFTTRPAGTGLGLAVASSIIKAHKGSFWLDSEPGEGSTFGMRLPIYRPYMGPSTHQMTRRGDQ